MMTVIYASMAALVATLFVKSFGEFGFAQLVMIYYGFGAISLTFLIAWANYFLGPQEKSTDI